MRKLLLGIFAACLIQQAAAQRLALDLYGGGGSSSKPYHYGLTYQFLPTGTVTKLDYNIKGFYIWGTNISYIFFQDELGLYLETNNRIADDKSISYRSNILSIGLSWRKPLPGMELELLGGYGYSWDKYELSDSNRGKYSITAGIPILHAGFNIYYPISNFLELTAGLRVTKNYNAHIRTSSPFFSDKGLSIPSVLYTGTLGISINIFKERY